MTKMKADMHGHGLLITGETRPHKDLLKSQGGSWNNTLKGWIFAGSKKPAVLGGLQSAGIDVKDNTSHQPEPEPAAKKQKTGTLVTKKQKTGTCAAAADAAAGSDDVCSWQLGGPKCGSAAAAAAVAPGDSDGHPRKFISVKQGPQKVDIREWYGDASDPKYKSLGGLDLNAEEWDMLKLAIPDIDREIKRLRDS